MKYNEMKWIRNENKHINKTNVSSEKWTVKRREEKRIGTTEWKERKTETQQTKYWK